MKYLYILTLACIFQSCNAGTAPATSAGQELTKPADSIVKAMAVSAPDTFKVANTIHVLVALCDNMYQGIIKVPEKIGNGQNPNANLYWGCGYGIRTYFKKNPEWQLIKSLPADTIRLERLVFKHRTANYYLIADAYDGRYIEQCTRDLLAGCAGSLKDTFHIGKTIIGAGGNAKMLAYIGHDGLMDFTLEDSFKNVDGKTRDCIILACRSRAFFTPHLRLTKANPMVWTTNLMCPEAYTLYDALSGYVRGGKNEQVRSRAALAYAKYQKCGEKAARGLLVTGWE